MGKEVVSREARFVTHVPTKSYDIPDVHLVKERINYADGTHDNEIRIIKDFKRKFWMTKPAKRDHKQKREYEKIENLLEYECTQSELRNRVAKALGVHSQRQTLKDLSESPYLYGSDIPASSFIKSIYAQKYPSCNMSPYTVCNFDTETDMLHGTKDIIIVSLSFGKRSVVFIERAFLEGVSEPLVKLQEYANKHLSEDLNENGLDPVEFVIVERKIDLLIESFKLIHQWKPDFLAIWNEEFDIGKIEALCGKEGIDPRTILCDPTIPKEYQIYKFKPGLEKQVTASGKVKPVKPANRWHQVELSASFFIIDAMCTYRRLRLSDAELPSYSFDSILERHKITGKLYVEEVENMPGEKKHITMQSRYKIEYIIYAAWDTIGMTLLDAVTKDLSNSLPSGAAFSDFNRFNSMPYKIADAFFHYAIKKGYILGTVGKNQKVELGDDTMEYDGETEDDDEDAPDSILSLKNWICTLKSYLSELGGKFAVDSDELLTLFRAFVYDSDETSAYPNGILTLNISKRTTKRELIEILGIPESLFRRQNLNLVIGETNAIEYCVNMFGFDTPDELLKEMMM